MNVLDLKEFNMRVHGELVTITADTIKATCDWYADNQLGCIDEVENGGVYVNDPKQYKKDCLERCREYRAGDFEPGLWFWQQAYYLQSGESVPMLSK